MQVMEWRKSKMTELKGHCEQYSISGLTFCQKYYRKLNATALYRLNVQQAWGYNAVKNKEIHLKSDYFGGRCHVLRGKMWLAGQRAHLWHSPPRQLHMWDFIGLKEWSSSSRGLNGMVHVATWQAVVCDDENARWDFILFLNVAAFTAHSDLDTLPLFTR